MQVDDENQSLEIKGRDMITGLPKVVTITEEQVREALKEPVYAIIESIKTTLKNTTRTCSRYNWKRNNAQVGELY